MAESIISPGVFQRENDISFVQPAPVAAGAAFIGPTVKGPVEIPTVVTSYGEYQRKFGDTFELESAKHEFLTSMAVKNYFDQGGDTALVARVVSGSFTSAQNTHISASDNGSTQPFTIETLGEGVLFNNATSSTDPGKENSDGSLVSGSVDNLRWEVANVNQSLGTFSLFVRRGDDSARSKVILESFNNLSLDPNSDNYIESVIGNQSKTLNTADGGYIQTSGEFINRSNYIRVSEVNLKTLNYLANDGKTVNTDSNGASYTGSLPVEASGAFFDATGRIADDANLFDNIGDSNTQGLAGSDYDDVITLLGNKDDFQFNIITAPGLIGTEHGAQVNNIISLAETRGDCIAVIDPVGYQTTVANAAAEGANYNSSYAAAYWPWLQMRSATGRNEWVPASVVIPGVYSFTDNSSAPWFAPAGLVRGGIGGVIQAERKLTKQHRDTLYSNKINPIATFPGQGISVFGQKTLQTKASALDRVNVRRLLIELKKFIGDQSRNLVFEQNTTATRNRFLATVNPYLESVVQRQGLFAYRVVMDDTNNTADVVDRNQLVGQIFIQPAKTAEFVVLDFTIEPTGATFEG